MKYLELRVNFGRMSTRGWKSHMHRIAFVAVILSVLAISAAALISLRTSRDSVQRQIDCDLRHTSMDGLRSTLIELLQKEREDLHLNLGCEPKFLHFGTHGFFDAEVELGQSSSAPLGLGEYPEHPGNLTYNIFETMWKGRTEKVVLRLSVGEETVQKIASQYGGGSNVQTIMVAPDMSAALTGSAGLSIQPVGADIKHLWGALPTQWDWSVTPVRSGKDEILRVTVSLVTGDGSTHPIYAVEHPVSVKATLLGRASDTVASIHPIWKFVVGIVSGMYAAYLWAKRGNGELVAGKNKGGPGSGA